MDLKDLIAYLDAPAAKYILALVGGLILRAWPAFVNRAVPTTLTAVGVLITILNGLFPDVAANAPATLTQMLQGGIHFRDLASGSDFVLTTQYQYAGNFFGSFLGRILIDGILPVILAIGTASGLKNTGQWVQDGPRFINPKR